jgi:hypothetical protein
MTLFYRIAAFAGLISCTLLQAQNETDALRYSRLGFGGTARYNAMGGAFGALGGDMSVICVNPAGLAIYRKNELTFTPSFFNQRVSSTYNGTFSDDARFNFRFDNFGFVFAGVNDTKSDEGWQSVGFGVAYTRLASFQSNVRMTGQATTSLMDAWSKTASGTGPGGLDAFNEGLAWNTWMLNTLPGDSTRYTDTIPDGTLLNQTKTIESRGGVGEWTFGLAGNYSNRLYIGASIGIPQVKYEEIAKYSEEEVNDTVSNFSYLSFRQNLVTKGSGFNFRVGLIYRATDFLRMGIAVHTPSILRLNDTYQSDMTSLIGGVNRQDESPQGRFDYTVRTPLRTVLSLGIIIGKRGLISADYEYVDYSDARLRSSQFAFNTANDAIRSKYQAASNLRVGGELNLAPLSFRAGFALYGSPYTSAVNNNATRTYITGGFGYRDPEGNFFVDGTILTSQMKDKYYFYDQSLANPVENKWSVVNVMLTVGFKY